MRLTISSKLKTVLLLVTFISIGSFLRLYNLDKFPVSLFGDEVDVGYQAYSILKTGKDYMGQPWPLSFHSVADWRTPLYLYATVPFVAIFGLNGWGVRLPAAIFGILTLPLFYLLVQKLFSNKQISLLSLFLLSFSMWHLQYSRAAFEVTQMLFLLIWGLWLFFVSLKNPKWLWLSGLLLALIPYSYNTAKLFLPLIGLLLLIFYWKDLLKLPVKNLLLSIIVTIIVIAPMTYDIVGGKASNRFSGLSIFSDPTTEGQIGFDRLADVGVAVNELPASTSPSIYSRLFHNNPVFWGFRFVNNYLEAFSSSFLFTKGDINYRHSVQGGFGNLIHLDVLFLVFGLVGLYKQKTKKTAWFIIAWLLLTPIPSALTRDGANHATRLILMLPPLLIICALGFNQIINSLTKVRFGKIIIVLIITGYCSLITMYLHRYYVHYPRESERWWHYGYKQTIRYAISVEAQYDYVVISDRLEPPLVHLLFWAKVDPRIMQKTKLTWSTINQTIKADHLEGTKYYLGHADEEMFNYDKIGNLLSPKILYIATGGEIKLNLRHDQLPNSVKVLYQIYYPSGLPAYYVLTGV